MSGYNNPDVIVIGAGIIGCACADSLASSGRQVTIIESNVVGGGATAAGMGHLVVMDDNAAELALTQRSLQLWRDLVADHPRLHEYSRCGTLWIASDEEEMQAAANKQSVLQGAGVACELLNAVALYRKEPALREGLAGALLVHDDGLVYPPKSARLLLQRALDKGAHFLQGQVTRIDANSVSLRDGQQLHAEHIVVANGLAAMELLPGLPMRAKKGHLLITERYPVFVQHQLVELGYIKSAHAGEGDSVAFNLQPRPTGQLLLGSSRQFDKQDKPVELAMIRKMLEHAKNFIPSLGELKALRCWTGIRAATADGLPMLGPHPLHTGVWLATGHEGLGITTAMASAELITAHINDGPFAITPAPYLPTRFSALHEPA